MNPSLTICLPLRDGQAVLERLVQDALEVAAEMAVRYEVLVIDDGSRDATIEVADELATRYPQVRTYREPVPVGFPVYVPRALATCAGELIVLRSQGCRLPLGFLFRLAEMLGPRDTAFAGVRTESSRVARWVRRMTKHGGSKADSSATQPDVDLLLFRKPAARAIGQWRGESQELIAELERHELSWVEVPVTASDLGNIPRPPAGRAGTKPRRTPLLLATDPASDSPLAFGPIRDFALGE